MLTVMLVLIGVSLLLLILSFFLRDPIKDLREEIDQLSIQQVQEMYKIKKKLKVLEEELMIGEENFAFKPSSAIKESKSDQAEISNQFMPLLKIKFGHLRQVAFPLIRSQINLPYRLLKFSKL